MSSVQSMGTPIVEEYYGIYSPIGSLYSLAKDRYRVGRSKLPPYVIFTDPTRNGRGRALEQFIKDSGFGVVTRSEAAINPNSHNELEIFVFKPDDAKLRALKRHNTLSEKLAYAAHVAAGRYGWQFEFRPSLP